MGSVLNLNSQTLSRAIWFYPGLNSTPFNAMTPHGGFSVPANSSGNIQVSFQIPGNSWGILKGFGITTAVTPAWSNLSWTLRINNIPVPGYANFCDQISTLIHLNYLFKSVKETDIIDLIVQNTSLTTAYVTYARLVGWYDSSGTLDDLTAQLDQPPPVQQGGYILYKIDEGQNVPRSR